MNGRLFEEIYKSCHLTEASGSKTADAIAKKLDNYDGTDAGAKDLIKFISMYLGQAYAIGTSGIVNDLPDYYQGHTNVENMVLAAAAARSKEPQKAFNFYVRYGKQLNINIDPAAVKAAIQAAQESRALSLKRAQQQQQSQK